MSQEPQLKSVVIQKSRPQQVREMAAFVAEKAEFIRIRHENIATYTAEMLRRYPLITSLDAHSHFLSEASPAATAAFVLALDSINFGSGYFKIAKEAGVSLEYSVVASALRKAFGESRMNTPEKWLAATAADMHEIFNVPPGAHRQLDRLMGLFADHLGGTGQQTVESYDGDVMNLLEATRNSAAQLAEIVATWPTFHDVAIYKGVEIPVFKRAQIVAADMHLAFHGKPPAAFTDMDALTCFADNMVPHVLRCDGILEYAPELLSCIEAGEMIEQGSPEEVELRACAIHAVELMKQAAQAQGANITSVNIDHILWNRGYEPEIYSRPSHQTMTVWY
jgi:hypothetical protein